MSKILKGHGAPDVNRTATLGITTLDADSNEYKLTPRYVYSSEYIE